MAFTDKKNLKEILNSFEKEETRNKIKEEEIVILLLFGLSK